MSRMTTSYGPAIGRVAVDGLILDSLVGEDPLVEAARQRRLPTVVVDSPAPGDLTATTGFDFVGIDEQAAAETAVQHLLELGHRRLAILSLRLSTHGGPGPADARVQAAATASVAKGRLEGAARAATAAGVDWSTVPVEQCQVSDLEHGRAGAHALLDRAPDTTAIFAFSDPLALGARLAAHERGLGRIGPAFGRKRSSAPDRTACSQLVQGERGGSAARALATSRMQASSAWRMPASPHR